MFVTNFILDASNIYMSFVILRNRDNQPPNAFDNEFQNTITIPANSEVALHSTAPAPLASLDCCAFGQEF